ncbi:MAG: NAD-dependent epimerase/dehydratase family protein [Elusimicrobia bacterium]|nr:NAD-dependent epimerase/dehydratase family protein [Elusimicrobiota bacterium]
MRVLITGSSGLIGSEAVEYYARGGHEVSGVDNNMRRVFFGEPGDTLWRLGELKGKHPGFSHHAIDIRDRDGLTALFKSGSFDLIIHCAAQPSHDQAAAIPLLDFDVNAGGTLNMLEAARQHCPEAVFIHMSTNKVYGDAPNELPLVELPTRFDYAEPARRAGIGEDCRIDRCLHSLFGASKAASDLMAQEYGRYFGMKVGVFRGGCLTGPSQSGVELHGFLSYLVKAAVQGKPYTVFGYKGKQVRDQIHSMDVIRAFDAFAADPRPGEVYNIGGGRENSLSVLEALEMVGNLLGRKVDWEYREAPRRGDHVCYISDLAKLKSHFPAWGITRSLPSILEEMVAAERLRLEPRPAS